MSLVYRNSGQEHRIKDSTCYLDPKRITAPIIVPLSPLTAVHVPSYMTLKPYALFSTYRELPWSPLFKI